MIKASTFALKQNQTLMEKYDLLPTNENHKSELIDFMKGDPTFYDSEECKMTQEGYDIMKDSIDNPDNHSYTSPAGTDEARMAIAEAYDHGKGLTMNDVIITSGVNQGLLYTLWACCDPGSNILIPEIGYPFYDGLAGAYGVDLRRYKVQPEKNWEIDLKDLNEQLDDNTSFVYIVNPSNPCGSVYSKKHIQEIIQWAQDNCVLLIVDESYYGLSFGEFTSFGEMAQDGPIITVNGMDKNFFVPGWATAWVIFYDKNNYAQEIKEAFYSIIQILLHSNVFIMGAIPKILEKLTPNFGQQACKLFEENSEYLVQELSKIRGIKCQAPQGTYYMPVFLDLDILKVEDDTQFAQEFLIQQNVRLLPLSWFGSKKYQGFRMLLNANNGLYQDFIQRLNKFIVMKQK